MPLARRLRSSAESTACGNCVYVSFYRDRPNIGLSSSRLWRNGKVSSDDRDNLHFLKTRRRRSRLAGAFVALGILLFPNFRSGLLFQRAVLI